MKNNKVSKVQIAVFPSRTPGTVTCPHCWTEQRTNRNLCYQCGAQFQYADEIHAVRKIVC